MAGNDSDEALLFTVASVWREARVSCPHLDILRAWLTGSLDEGPQSFVRFHLEESQCPYCNAVVADLKVAEATDRSTRMDDVRDRLMCSTVAALRRRPHG